MTDFRINVIVDPAQARQGIRQVDRSLERVEDRGARVRRALGRAFALAGLGAGVAGVVRLVADFEQEVSTVQAVSSATAEEIAALESEFKELGATTRFSASQAAEGATFLARAGFEANEILESLDDTLQLAQAGALGLGNAADIASNVLTGFRLETSEAGRVVDVLALAANSANTDVSQLGQALKFVAPVAAGVGVELEETTAAISALSNAGLQASLAGTGLRRILSELESPAAKSQAILAQFGLTADDVRVSQVGLTTALQRLADAGIDTGTALELFGDRGGPAFEVLRNSIPDIEAATDALDNADGTAARIAETMDDNLNGAILAARSAFEALLLSLGDAGGTEAARLGFEGLATSLRTLANNAELVAGSLAVLSAALVGGRVVAFTSGVLEAASAFVTLRAAVLSGNAVVLGSAEAARQQAAAELASAQATATNTAAQLANAQAQTAKALVVRGATEATFAQAAVTQQLTALEAQNVAAANAVTAAQARLASATAATTVRARLLNATFAVNPFVLLIAGATAAFFALRKLDEVLDEIEETQAEADLGARAQLTTYGLLGEEIQRVERQLEIAREAVERNGDEFVVGQQKVAEYETRLESLRAQQERLEQNTDAARRAAEAQRRAVELVNAAFEDSIQTLDQERMLLALNTRERSIQAELLKEIASIEKDGAPLTEEQREQLEAEIRRNSALREQVAILDELRGPQEEFNARLEAARTLFEQERISAEELAQIVQELSESGFDLPDLPDLPDVSSPEIEPATDAERVNILADLNAQLAEEERLLKLSKNARDAEVESIRIEQELRRQGVELGPMEREQLETRVAQLQALSRQGELLESLRGPQDEFARGEEDLNLLLEANIITTDEYAAALERLKEIQAEVNDNPPDPESVTAYAAALDTLEDVGVSALTAAKDALLDFVVTGEGSFEDFTASLLQNLKRILAEKALIALIDAFTGGAASAGSGVLGAVFGGGRQEGGDVQPGRTFLVGEEGPELFTPPNVGEITPAGETAAQLGAAQPAPQVTVNTAPPVVNVTNVSDPSEIPSAIEDGEADDAIMNVIQRRRRQVKGTIG